MAIALSMVESILGMPKSFLGAKNMFYKSEEVIYDQFDQLITGLCSKAAHTDNLNIMFHSCTTMRNAMRHAWGQCLREVVHLHLHLPLALGRAMLACAASRIGGNVWHICPINTAQKMLRMSGLKLVNSARSCLRHGVLV